MTKFIALLLVAHACAQALANEQIWQIAFPSIAKIDTIRIQIRSTSDSDLVVSESFYNSTSPYATSRYTFNPDSGYKWIESANTCDTTADSQFAKECRIINATATKTLAFFALGNLSADTGASSYNCTQNKSCRYNAHSMNWTTNTMTSTWGMFIDSSRAQAGGDSILQIYDHIMSYRFSGESYSHLVDSSSFLNDTACIRFFHQFYIGESGSEALLRNDIIEGNRILLPQTSLVQQRERSQPKSPSRAFVSADDFRTWIATEMGPDVQIMNSAGRSIPASSVKNVAYVRTRSQAYRVFILND